MTSINRNIGVWSNNYHIHGHIGVASSKDSAYFAWQDSRNGNSDFQSEDIYFASARFTSEVRSEGDDSGVPAGLQLAAGVLLGMGLAMVIVVGISRRRGRAATA